MRRLVLHGATLACSQGLAPSNLSIAPGRLASSDHEPLATVSDHVAVTNIAPFGMCGSMANPAVASATAAAQGALTPQPCVPVTPSPWSQLDGGVTVDGAAALFDDATCTCTWNGSIAIRRTLAGPTLR